MIAASLLGAAGVTSVLYAFARDVIGIVRHQRPDYAHGVALTGCLMLSVANALQDEWAWTAWFLFLAAVNAGFWWRRRKRRRALATLGAKARALRDSLVRRMREVTKPRPILKPQRMPV